MATRRTREITNKRRQKRKQSRKPKRSLWFRLLRALVLLGLFCGVLGAAGLAGLFYHYGRSLPEIADVGDYSPIEVSRVYASDGEVIEVLVGEDALVRTVVPWEEIPESMRFAILAAEDASFYEHPGMDIVGVVRAALTNIARRRLSQGASTITQQVVKNLVLSPERSIRRKVQEIILAFRLEKTLSKDEILTIYLNEVFFGSRYYGVEEAARYYFGHGAADLTLAESATLAGLVQSPNRYNPFRHPERALERRAYVLRQMWEKGFIEESVYRDADAEPLALDEEHGRGAWEGQFPHYVDALWRDLEIAIAPELLQRGGLRIYAAMDRELQSIAQDAMQRGLEAFDSRHGYHTPYATADGDEAIAQWRAQHDGDIATLGLSNERDYRAVVIRQEEGGVVFGVGEFELWLVTDASSRALPDGGELEALFPRGAVFTVRGADTLSPDQLAEIELEQRRVAMLPSAEGALVSIDPSSRQVLALVGGYDFATSSFNRGVQARRQVGSAFKPFVYGAALEARVITPATRLADQPITFPMHGGETWQPRNYDGRFLGPMSVRTSLARSRNVIAVRVLDLVGLGPAQEFARQAGVTGELTDNLTLALGSAELTPLDVTNGFATFAASGFAGDPVLLVRVENRAGDQLYVSDANLREGISPDVAWLTSSMMRSVVDRGTARAAGDVGHPVAGKTGTTNGARDAWFLGFSRSLVTGVWVGRDDNAELGRGETGGSTALPIWVSFMTRALQDREVREFPDPPRSIEAVDIDDATGLRAHPGQSGASREYFLSGTAPAQFAPLAEDNSMDDVLLNGGSVAPNGGTAPSIDGF
ncbi:MAG: penicillin-binding protein 1A [Bradymonadia bacterium]